MKTQPKTIALEDTRNREVAGRSAMAGEMSSGDFSRVSYMPQKAVCKE
jgi:hypothetical protein